MPATSSSMQPLREGLERWLSAPIRIEILPRPWYVKNVKDAYAVRVAGESMIDKFEPGDVVIVNPRAPHIRGKAVILVQGEERGEFIASLKILVSWTATHWRLKQLNPAKEFTWTKRDWPRALPVVGSYYGL